MLNRQVMRFSAVLRPRKCIAKDDGKGEIMSTSSKKLETILVVDNDEKVLKVLVEILKLAKFHVLSADNGAEAIKLAKETKRKIDLLLSDVTCRYCLVRTWPKY
jgi:PleD family two-component response regulator